MRCGNLCDGIELFIIRLRAIEFTKKHVALVACFRTDVIEEGFANQSPKSPEGRSIHTPGITFPERNQRKLYTLQTCTKEANALPGCDFCRISKDFSKHGGIVHGNWDLVGDIGV